MSENDNSDEGRCHILCYVCRNWRCRKYQSSQKIAVTILMDENETTNSTNDFDLFFVLSESII